VSDGGFKVGTKASSTEIITSAGALTLPSNLTVTGNSLLKGTLGAGTGGTTFTVAADGALAIATDRFTVSAAGVVVAASTVKSTGDFTVGDSKFVVTAASGNTLLQGTLGAGTNGTTFTVAADGALAIATDKFTVSAAGAVVAASTVKSTGDFTVGDSKFVVTAASGNTLLQGTLGAGTNGTTFTVAADGALAIATTFFTVSAAGALSAKGAVAFGANLTEFTVSTAGAVVAASTVKSTGDFTVGDSKFVVTASSGAIAVGSEAFATAGSGIALDGVTKHSGIQFYFDDGGAKLAAGYTEAFRTGYLVSAAITTADVSLYTSHDYVYLAQNVTTAGGVGGTWGSMLVKTGVTITTSSGVCDFSGAHFTCDVPSGATIGTGTWACGASVGGNLGGTHTGNAAGYRVRVPSAGKWDVGLRVEPLSCVEYLQVGTASFSASGSGIPIDGVTYHSAAEIYFDDGGSALQTGYIEGVMTGYLISTATSGVDCSVYTCHDYVYIAENFSTAGGVGASWASLLVKTGATITTESGVCDFSAFNASCDVPSGATIAASTFVSGISMGGNLGGTHSGKAVAFRVRAPSAGAWDGLFDIPTALSGGSNGIGTDVYIDVMINGTAARLTAKYVA
jgi:hypothetical protein